MARAKCTDCEKQIYDNVQSSLKCVNCEGWTHEKCLVAGTKKINKEINKKSENNGHVCMKCVGREKSEVKDHVDQAHHMSKGSQSDTEDEDSDSDMSNVTCVREEENKELKCRVDKLEKLVMEMKRRLEQLEQKQDKVIEPPDDEVNKEELQEKRRIEKKRRTEYRENKIRMIEGDLLDFAEQTGASIAHCVAEDFKMGAGIAKELKGKHPPQVEELKRT